MPTLYEIIELANGDIALQREGESSKGPLVTMRFSTELLRFMRGAKIDIAKIMIEAGLEQVAQMAETITPPHEPVAEQTARPAAVACQAEWDMEPEELTLTPDAGSHLLH